MEAEAEAELGCSLRAIDSSNVGFQLLKKCGWTEGTGLGAAEQGRLEPVETRVKNNKRGIGSQQEKKRPQIQKDNNNNSKEEKKSEPKKKAKASKRLRKMQEEERRLKETEFERAFFRDFWPDNV